MDSMEALSQHSVNTKLAQAFSKAKACLFLVGGSVRDALHGAPDFSDLDFTTKLRPKEILKIVSPLGPTWTVGEEFGTICVQIQDVKVEITTFRTEKYEEDSRKPVVAFGETISDDLKRRDLTINALALCLVGDGNFLPGDLVDLFGGALDLRSGTLRTPDEPSKTVSEDPLRQLRAIRFAVKRQMTIDPELKEAIRHNAFRLSIISTERICEELRKILLAGGAATQEAIDLATDLGVDKFLFGGLSTKVKDIHGINDPLTLLAAFADATLKEGSSPHKALKALKLSNEEIRPALAIASAKSDFLAAASMTDVRRIVRRENDSVLSRSLELAHAQASSRLSLEVEAAKRENIRGPLPLNGDDLLMMGLKGPSVGKALKLTEEMFLLDPNLAKSEAQEMIQKEMAS